MPRGNPRETGLLVHISLGLAIVAFVAARLYWRLSDSPPRQKKSPLGAWGEWAGKAVQFLIYALLIVVPIAGVLAQFALWSRPAGVWPV